MPAKKAKSKKAKTKATKPKGSLNGLFSVKRHISEGHILIAACDLDLLGKTLEDGDLCLEVRESFYGGEKVGPDILGRLLEMSTMANLVGKRAIALAIEMGIVNEDCVIFVKGVPHAQCLKFL